MSLRVTATVAEPLAPARIGSTGGVRLIVIARMLSMLPVICVSLSRIQTMSAPATPFTSTVSPATLPNAIAVILSEPAWKVTVSLSASELLLTLPVAFAFDKPSSSTPITAFLVAAGPAPSVIVIGWVAVSISPSPSLMV